MNKEIRFRSLTDAAKDEMVLEGYAAVFNQPTVLYSIDGIDYKEQIDRNAFTKTITKNCCLKYNHMDSTLILARVRGGSMQLTIDDHGLFFRATLFNTGFARDVYEMVRAGGLDQCSFAFNIAEDGQRYDRATKTCTITGISELWDCAICANPAYEQTCVSARDYFTAQEEMAAQAEADAQMEAEAAAQQLEIKRKKLILLSRL